jgi:4-hydroxybenzoate polyprenyltransferase
MTAIQFSIGALNDLVDAPRDVGRRPMKPIPENLVGRGLALAVAAGAAIVGFALSAASGTSTLVVAAIGAACGYAYDLRLSRTPWAWLPLSVALPLVPIYAWLGATGSLPAGLAVLVPIGLLAGGGLAVGNALADLALDEAARIPSVAVRLGGRDAWRVHALALAAAVVLALASLPGVASSVAVALLVSGCAAIAGGTIGLAPAGRGARPWVARLAWPLEAVGVALLGIGWLVARAAGPAGPA